MLNFIIVIDKNLECEIVEVGENVEINENQVFQLAFALTKFCDKLISH